MSFNVAPGHVLQLHYLRQRLKRMEATRFIEVGSGNGLVSSTLLKAGLHGIGFDLNAGACENNKANNGAYIASGAYKVIHGDFLSASIDHKVDLVISCMVIEHMPASLLQSYIAKCKSLLAPNGVLVSIVPASPRHWGIEDEIAGHVKRYTRSCFEQLAEEHGMKVRHTAGLTFPMSNLLLSISNRLVARKERGKLGLSMDERTVDSGNRDVRFKTTYPSYFRLLINDVVLSPFILLQHLFRSHPSCLVLYNEMSWPRRDAHH